MFTIRVTQIEAPRHLKRNKRNNIEEMIQLSQSSTSRQTTGYISPDNGKGPQAEKDAEFRFYQAESDTS